MDFVDRILTCTDCGGEFIFTAGEQLFFLDKQFKNDPKRCKPCKSRRGAQSAGAAPGSGPGSGWHLTHRDAHRLLGVRHRDDRPIQAHPRPPRALPPVLQEQSHSRRSTGANGIGSRSGILRTCIGHIRRSCCGITPPAASRSSPQKMFPWRSDSCEQADRLRALKQKAPTHRGLRYLHCHSTSTPKPC